jgi:hypothetical protein
MTGEVQPQDQASGLVARSWQRRTRRQGDLTERTLEGEEVKAAWLDGQGQVRRAAGKVIRNEAGALAIESRADQVRQETEVPRDASVDVIGHGR